MSGYKVYSRMTCDDGLRSMWGLSGLCIGLSLLLVSCSSPLVRKGDRAASEGQWDQAVASYREALKKDPFNPKIQASLDDARTRAGAWHFAAGQQALDDHRLGEALREFKQALAFDPSKQAHHGGMAEALRLKEAHDHLEAAGKLVGLGRSEEALAIYERKEEKGTVAVPFSCAARIASSATLALNAPLKCLRVRALMTCSFYAAGEHLKLLS